MKRKTVIEQGQLLERLRMATQTGPDCTGPLGKMEMLSAIEQVEQISKANLTPAIANALAYAILCYTSFHVEGDDRKPLLERACVYYRHAGNTAALSRLLVEEGQIQNLREALPLLKQIYESSTVYDPVLCCYAEALLKDGQYIAAYKVAMHIGNMAKDSDSEYRPPTTPMTIAAKALRAEAKRLNDDGREKEATRIMELLKGTGHETPNDLSLFGNHS